MLSYVLVHKTRLITNGGGGMKDAAPPPAPPAPPPPPPPTEDQGPDPAMQAEIERQRALRFKTGQLGTEGTTGTDQVTGTVEETKKKTTLLGE